MDKFIDRKYIVRENGPVYFTEDMDQTVKWFENVLGWYSEIDERNEEGKGMYGCVFSIPDLLKSHILPHLQESTCFTANQVHQ